MKTLLATLLEEFREKLEIIKASGIPRKASFPEAKNLIKVAIGMRRTGKTFFVLQQMLKLLKKGIPLESILYINFEDDRLLPMDYKKMGTLIDTFYTLYPENHTRECHIVLDEVQNIPDWAVVVRRIFDTKKVQLYLTGSSAKLLSKEIATSLRGRSIEREIWPFSFTEFLSAHSVDTPVSPLGKKASDQLRKHLLDYMTIGGFPAVQFLTPPDRLQTLQGYVETVIIRDIVERHHVTNITLLRYMIITLLKNTAAPFSINKFYNDIKSQGHKVGKDTLYNYLGYLEDAYLLFAVPHFSESVRTLSTAPKKMYVIDDGLLLANTFSLSKNFGKLFENLIFLEIRRQAHNIYYYKTYNDLEIDFVVTSKQSPPKLIQVCWELDDPVTREREERALREAEKELGIKGIIIDYQTYLNNGIDIL